MADKAKSKNKDRAVKDERPQDVDRIRDIIFGSQINEYEQQFERFQRDLERLQGEIEQLRSDLIEQGEKGSKGLQDQRSELRKADEDLRQELRDSVRALTSDKADRKTLGELLAFVGRAVSEGGSPGALLDDLLGDE